MTLMSWLMLVSCHCAARVTEKLTDAGEHSRRCVLEELDIHWKRTFRAELTLRAISDLTCINLCLAEVTVLRQYIDAGQRQFILRHK